MSMRTKTNRTMSDGFDAKHMSLEAKAACKALHFTPRRWEPINSNWPVSGGHSDHDVYDVMIVWNSREEIRLTNQDLDYANRYLR
jgi:hypothetical protein